MSLTNAPDPAVRAGGRASRTWTTSCTRSSSTRRWKPSRWSSPARRVRRSSTPTAPSISTRMAGLWCVNIGYGRTELAEVAADQMRQLSYFPHTAMNVPAAALAEKINGLMGGGYHTYFVNSGSEANEAGFKIARQYMKHEHPGRIPLQDDQPLFRLSRHDARHPGCRRHGRAQGEVRAVSPATSCMCAPPYCYRCPFGLSYPSCGLACVKNMETTILGEGPETVAEVHRRADHERRRRRRAARRVPARGREPVPQIRHPSARRRGHQRLRPHRQDVRAPALRRVARHHRGRQGHLQRLPADRRDGGEEQRVRQLLRRAGGKPAGRCRSTPMAATRSPPRSRCATSRSCKRKSSPIARPRSAPTCSTGCAA